jgi:tRNA dimethylallyltransferase
MNLKKILVLIGPTASGKSELGVSLAKKFNGEIISADSRQIYKDMDLGTGKVEGKWKKDIFIYKNTPYYCIDFINPKVRFSVARFQKITKKIIANILKRGKLPILVGGTGHYIDAVVYNIQLPNVKPNLALRKKLEQFPTERLFAQIKNKDPIRAKTIDPHNRRRLIRALEILLTTGKPVPVLSPDPLTLSTLWLGITLPQETLYKKIEKRLKERLKLGMIKEVEKLKKSGLSYKRLESFGLEYKFIALYLQKKITYKEMEEKLLFAIKHYSKRQLTWWKKNKEIHWIKPNLTKATKLTQQFLSQ